MLAFFATVILQLIGLIFKNRFLLIPYIIASILALAFVFYVMLIMASIDPTNFLKSSSFFYFLLFKISKIYFIIANIILFRKITRTTKTTYSLTKEETIEMTADSTRDDKRFEVVDEP